MGDDEKGKLGIVEIAAVGVVALFAAAVLFVLFGAIAGAVWWTLKMAVLVLVLFVMVRWAFRRATR